MNQEFILGDPQADTMASLAVMHFYRRWQSLYELRPKLLDSYDRDKLLLVMLNWIATCFVIDPIGDVVATALTANPHEITVYVATNRSQPTDEDKEIIQKFKELIRNALEKPQEEDMTLLILGIISPRIYPRFSRKLHMITKWDPEQQPVEDRFNATVDRWAAGTDVGANMENSDNFLNNAQVLFSSAEREGIKDDEDANQCLKRLFKLFVDEIRSDRDCPEDNLTCKRRILRLSYLAMLLTNTDFFNSFREQTEPSFYNLDLFNSKNPIHWLDGTFLWIQKLRRRLRRVTCYVRDTRIFAKDGLQFIRGVLGDGISAFLRGEGGIEIVWIGEQPNVLPTNQGQRVTMTKTPLEFLDKLLDKFGYKIGDVKEETRKHLDKTWDISKPEEAYLHCEIQMIAFLNGRSDIQIHDNFIGSSKLMCWACDAYVAKVNVKRRTKGQKEWVLSGSSRKPHSRWLIPPGALGTAVVNEVRNELNGIVGRLAPVLGCEDDEDDYSYDHVDLRSHAFSLAAAFCDSD